MDDRKHHTSGAYRANSGGAPVSDGRAGGQQRYVGGRNGGRGDRNKPREREREQRAKNSRGRANYTGTRGDSYNVMKGTPTILSRQEKRSDPPTLLPSPGAVSIMQRESSSSHIPNSPPMPPAGFPSSHGDPLPPSSSSSSHIPQSVPQVLKSRDEGKGRSQRRQENVSSGPSNFTPLQPGMRGGARGEPGGGHSRVSAADHSVFLSQTSEMSHSVKLIDRNLHWEEKGSDFMLEQSDFLVVGVLGKQGVGKSTIMSMLAGTRTGAPKPFMFRTQSKETYESGGFQTTGVDMVVTAERVLLLDTQPVLSETLLGQISRNESSIPPGLSAEAYLEVMSLKMAIFLFSVCHVVLVVMDSLESPDMLFRFLWTAEQMKSNCLRLAMDTSDVPPDKKPKEYFPQLVFVLNHASADDYQPFSLREAHLLLADNFHGAKFSINGGLSLLKSGVVPVGKGFPVRKVPKTNDNIDPADVNLHLLPTNTSATDTFGVYTASRPENSDTNLNPILKLLTAYTGHPSYTLLSEMFRNQIFSMPRSPICRSSQQQLTEREWYEYTRRIWMMLKKSDLLAEYERLLQKTS